MVNLEKLEDLLYVRGYQVHKEADYLFLKFEGRYGTIKPYDQSRVIVRLEAGHDDYVLLELNRKDVLESLNKQFLGFVITTPSNSKSRLLIRPTMPVTAEIEVVCTAIGGMIEILDLVEEVSEKLLTDLDAARGIAMKRIEVLK